MLKTIQAKLRLMGILAAIAAIVCDQLTKLWILGMFQDDPTRHLEVAHLGPAGFDLVLWWNRGISFGLLHLPSDLMPYILSAVALLVCIFLALWLWRAETKGQALALGLIIGGAFGNVIDRLQHGAVVDFLYTYWNKAYWPAFNIADSCICIGVFLLIFTNFWAKKPNGARLGKASETA